MIKRFAWIGGLCALFAAPVVAQDNVPPEITGVGFQISHFDGGYLPFVPFNPAVDLAFELDRLRVTVQVFDPDFSDDDDSAAGESVFYAFNMFWIPIFPYVSPEPPPVPDMHREFQPPGGDDGLRPPFGQTLTFNYDIEIPRFSGPNQGRLRGLFDMDVLWELRIAVSNTQSPCEWDISGFWIECTEPLDFVSVFIGARVNPTLAASNPRAFADAGADQIVAAGRTVTLDGSRTFDGFNVGFDQDSDNVFLKDEITFTWEWLSGPVRVDPVQSSQGDPTARVTLNEPGEYVYRLIADDNYNPIPTSDTVTITVVENLPGNEPPRAVIRGPARPVGLGSIVTLDGSESTDPDGDELRFRWTQTNELGDALAPDEILTKFQPLTGVETSIARWQANVPGTFYFRLLVSDAEFQSNATFAVEVLESAAAGETVVQPPPPASGDSANEAFDSVSSPLAPIAAPLCGAGLAPLMVATALLAPWGAFRRGRR